MPAARSFRRAILPLSIFAGVFFAHYAWLGLFSDTDPLQGRWVSVKPWADGLWLRRYVETRSYWLGFSYALSLAFAAVALRRYREERLCAGRNLALGGVGFSGVLAVAGCYLLGCCGSPMLAVYLSLFGASFLPLARPLVALATAGTIGLAWGWMNRSSLRNLRDTAAPADSARATRCPGVTASAQRAQPKSRRSSSIRSARSGIRSRRS